jgi:branched-chain amino acid transport system substrate-binding protein
MPSACHRDALTAADEVVIGALLPLSRPGAILTGFAMQTALTLAAEEINGAGGIAGKPLRLIPYDTGNSPEQAVYFAERLIQLDCAALLIGGHPNAVALAVKEVARQHGIPLIVPVVSADEVTADAQPEVFRIWPTFTMMAQMPAQWLTEVGDYNGDGVHFAVFIGENSSEVSNHIAAAEQWLQQVGIGHTTLAVDLPASDFSPVIARIVALEHVPDAIFIYVSGDAALALQQQVLNAGIGPSQQTLIVSTMQAQRDMAFWQQVPSGVFTVMPKLGPWPTTVTPLGAQFAERYRTYFDRWPEAQAFAAYDALHLAADAITRAESLAPDALIRALEATDIELAAGHYTFPYGSANPPDGRTVPAFAWHQWLAAPLLYLQYSVPNQPAYEAAVIWPAALRTVDTPVLRP